MKKLFCLSMCLLVVGWSTTSLRNGQHRFPRGQKGGGPYQDRCSVVLSLASVTGARSQVPSGSQVGIFPAPGGPQLASSGFQPSASHWPGRTGREPRVSFSVIRLSFSLTLRLPRVIVTFQRSIVLSLYTFGAFSLELEKRKLNSVAQVHWSSKSLSFCRC